MALVGSAATQRTRPSYGPITVRRDPVEPPEPSKIPLIMDSLNLVDKSTKGLGAYHEKQLASAGYLESPKFSFEMANPISGEVEPLHMFKRKQGDSILDFFTDRFKKPDKLVELTDEYKTHLRDLATENNTSYLTEYQRDMKSKGFNDKQMKDWSPDLYKPIDSQAFSRQMSQSRLNLGRQELLKPTLEKNLANTLQMGAPMSYNAFKAGQAISPALQQAGSQFAQAAGQNIVGNLGMTSVAPQVALNPAAALTGSSVVPGAASALPGMAPTTGLVGGAGSAATTAAGAGSGLLGTIGNIMGPVGWTMLAANLMKNIFPEHTVLGKIAKGISSIFSDKKLKENMIAVGKSPSGINIYEFNYKGLEGTYRGVLADEVPWASSTHKNGFKMVDYNKVDVDFEKLS